METKNWGYHCRREHIINTKITIFTYMYAYIYTLYCEGECVTNETFINLTLTLNVIMAGQHQNKTPLFSGT